MATKVEGVLKEMKIEAKYFGSPNKVVEDDSALRPARKIFVAKGQGPASRVGKVLDVGGIEASGGSKTVEIVKMASSNKIKSAELMEKDSASRAACKLVPCNVCVAKGEDAGCHICVAKASALDRIKLAGGDIIKAAAVAEKESKAKPFTVVTRSCLDKMEAAGGHIIRTAMKEGGVGQVVTVRLPDGYVKDLFSITPAPPLHPLSVDFFDKHPNLREAMLIGAAAALYTISRAEHIRVQYFKNGYVVVDFDLVEQ